MLRTHQAGKLRSILLSALGASALVACGGTTTEAGSGGQGVGGSGNASGGAGSSTGGVGTSSGGGGGGEFTATCTNPTEQEGGFVVCDEGYAHRPETGKCETGVPRDDVIGDAEICGVDQGCCLTDADCESLQYCGVPVLGQVPGAFCVSGCLQDADCAEGQICQCGSAPLGRCVQAACDTNEDCEGDALCGSWVTDNGCGPQTQFACHTADDQCAGPGDCAEGQECFLVDGVRQCQEQVFNCVVGRPFLVRDEIRVAGLCSRDDWCGEVEVEPARALSGLSADEREALFAHWSRAAQMEHASIAAFARFSLQLLSLGAPADLIEETNQAMVDETRHARLCLKMASIYQGSTVGPEPLDVNGVLERMEMQDIVRATIIEGCVGETVAALEAAESAEWARDASIRDLLHQIAEDESRHAQLAWRFIAWALKKEPSLAYVVQGTFAELLSAGAAEPDEAGPLAHHGLLSAGMQRRIRQEALRQVVEPSVAGLLGLRRESVPQIRSETGASADGARARALEANSSPG